MNKVTESDLRSLEESFMEEADKLGHCQIYGLDRFNSELIRLLIESLHSDNEGRDLIISRIKGAIDG